MGVVHKDQYLYVRSMGKLLRVWAVFFDPDTANRYMANHPDMAVVAEVSGAILLADRYDRGERFWDDTTCKEG